MKALPLICIALIPLISFGQDLKRETVFYQYAESSGYDRPIVDIKAGEKMHLLLDCCFLDSVKVLLNGQELLNKFVETDKSLSFAHSITVKLSDTNDTLRIELPQKGVYSEILLDKRYVALHLNRADHWPQEKRWQIIFQNHVTMYE